MQTDPILVIGANGKTGSRIAARLDRRGHAVRRGSRTAPIPFDWADPATWDAALDGVRAAYVSYFPDLAVPGAVEAVDALCRTARGAGVERIVLLSGRGEHHARRAEQVVLGCGIDATIVRAAWFAQNFTEGALRDTVLTGTFAMPGGDVREPIVDADDIADVAVAALTEPGHAGQVYEVTGPRLLTFAEMAAILSAATGRPIRHVPIGFDAFHAGLVETVGPDMADIVTAIARETLDGRNAHLADGVRRALGRPPRDFVDFAQAAAAAGAWSVAA